MLYLLQQLWWLLPLVGICAGVAGWFLHLRISAPRLRALERERDKMRSEFEAIATGERQGLRRASDEREQAFLRARDSIAAAKVAELDRTLAEVREQRDAHAGRAAELERALERVSAEASSTKGAPEAVEADPAHLRAVDEMNALRWRLRYFEARTRYLEIATKAAAPSADSHAIGKLTKERDAALAEVEELRAQEASQPRVRDEEPEALKWRARYLESRVRRLESEAAIDEEAEKRRSWRTRYLEERLKHHVGLAPAPKTDKETRRLKWRARYLDARVQHLEQRLAATAVQLEKTLETEAHVETEAPLEREAPVAEAPVEASVGQEVRPASMAAPREGAPDDLSLIDGMSPKMESALHALGIYHFNQIADWSPANVAWIDQYLRLRGRASRERWVEQARTLSSGASTGRKLYADAELA